jgi:hypothetical protein
MKLSTSLDPNAQFLLATVLATKIELASVYAVMTPSEWPDRDAAIRNIDDLRELVRQLFPDAVDPGATRILPKVQNCPSRVEKI